MMRNEPNFGWVVGVAVAIGAAAIVGSGLHSRVASGSAELGQFIYGEQGYVGLLVSIATLAGAAFSVNALLRQNRVAAAALLQSQLAEVATRFQKGIELLAAPNPSVQIGGMLILRDVANEAPTKYRATVVSVLVEYARENSAAQAQILADLHKETADGIPHRSARVAAASQPYRQTTRSVYMALLIAGNQRMILRQTEDAEPLDMAGVAIVNRDFKEVDFSECIFSGTRLVGTTFVNSIFTGARFAFDMHEGVEFVNSDVRRATFFASAKGARGGRLVLGVASNFENARVIGPVALTLDTCNVDAGYFEGANSKLDDCWFFETPPHLHEGDATGVVYQPRKGRGSFIRRGQVDVYQPGPGEPLFRVRGDREVDAVSE